MKCDKKGMIVAHLLDYIFIVFIALFGFIFLYMSFIHNIDQRDEQSLIGVQGVSNVQQYITEHRIKFENGEDIDIITLLQNKRYLQKYGVLPGDESYLDVEPESPATIIE